MSHELPAGKTPASDLTKVKNRAPARDYLPTLMDSPFFVISLFQQLRDLWRHPISPLPKEWRMEAALFPLMDRRTWFRDLPNQIRFLFEKGKPRPDGFTSRPIEVRSIWQDYRWQPASLLNSLLLHALVVILLVVPYALTRPKHVGADAGTFSRLYFSPADVPALAAAAKQQHGGGGGGERMPMPASRGRLPHFARVQLVPPSAMPEVVAPKLLATPTIIGPPKMELPEMQAQLHWGDPNGVNGPYSNGPGKNGGIGDGEDGGVGNKKGPSYGPDDDGTAYSPGFGGVTAPVPTFNPAPNYSEDARKAKLQGIVTLSLVVDAHGVPTNIRVVRSLGLGLDENAIATARTWRFKPGTRNGVPVPVHVMLEVMFRLF